MDPRNPPAAPGMNPEARFGRAVLERNDALGAGYYVLRLALEEAGMSDARPGQFVMVKGPWGMHPILPRAFSVLAAEAGWVEIMGKPVGRGTRRLGEARPGDGFTVLGPLGRPFPAPDPAIRDVLVGGGVGIPPLYRQAVFARRAGSAGQCEVIYGARTAAELVFAERIEGLDVVQHRVTDDGSAGERGLVTDVLTRRLDALAGESARVMSCGPNAMMRAVAAECARREVPCFLALEEQMGCGVGVCRSCMVPRPQGGYLCSCLEGPVVDAREVRL